MLTGCTKIIKILVLFQYYFSTLINYFLIGQGGKLRPTIIVPSLTKEEFYESLRLAVLHCQDYLDEVDPNDVKVITKRNLFETLVTMYDSEKNDK